MCHIHCLKTGALLTPLRQQESSVSKTWNQECVFSRWVKAELLCYGDGLSITVAIDVLTHWILEQSVYKEGLWHFPVSPGARVHSNKAETKKCFHGKLNYMAEFDFSVCRERQTERLTNGEKERCDVIWSWKRESLQSIFQTGGSLDQNRPTGQLGEFSNHTGIEGN